MDLNIVIGISTYGPIPRAESLIKSIYSNLEPSYVTKIVCCDDGTEVKYIKERRQFCQLWNVTLLENMYNIGIPATWNRLAKFDSEADILIIFSDGVRAIMPGWITRLVHFLENNENVGTVGLPLLHRNDDIGGGFKDDDSRWLDNPGLVGSAVGCVFAVRPKVLFSIENPDGSVGYWEDLISFHEEIHMGFKLAERGLLSYMLPWPPMSYLGGMAFSAHNELVWRKPSSYLSMEEFLKYVRQTKWYVKDYEPKYSEGVVDRMAYSRLMFSKYWGVLDEVEAGRRIQEIKGEQVDLLNEPQKFVHHLCVDPWPTRKIRWLDRAGTPQEKEIG